jgi:hypothetical protein
MATTTGRVQCLKIGGDPGGDFGLVQIRVETPTGTNVPPVPPPSPDLAVFIIWVLNQSEGPKELFTNELSKALRYGLRVTISHREDSSFMNEIQVEAPFEGSLV